MRSVFKQLSSSAQSKMCTAVPTLPEHQPRNEQRPRAATRTLAESRRNHEKCGTDDYRAALPQRRKTASKQHPGEKNHHHRKTQNVLALPCTFAKDLGGAQKGEVVERPNEGETE